MERFLRLDTLKLNKGWQNLYLQNPMNSPQNGFNYGVIPLGFVDDNFELLVFGGRKANGESMSRTCILNTNLSDFTKSKYSIINK